MTAWRNEECKNIPIPSHSKCHDMPSAKVEPGQARPPHRILMTMTYPYLYFYFLFFAKFVLTCTFELHEPMQMHILYIHIHCQFAITTFYYYPSLTLQCRVDDADVPLPLRSTFITFGLQPHNEVHSISFRPIIIMIMILVFGKEK